MVIEVPEELKALGDSRCQSVPPELPVLCFDVLGADPPHVECESALGVAADRR